MNPLTNVRKLNEMNERELAAGMSGTARSWHHDYRDSAWIFYGGLDYELSEGDVIAVFSQYGEVVHVNLVRDRDTGKSRGFGFLCYEDQRSTILAVDNLNGAKICKRIIRVDHVQTYKLPKDLEKMDEERKKLFLEGVAPKAKTAQESEDETSVKKEERSRKKEKKSKKKKKKKSSSKKRRRDSSSSSSSSDGRDRRRKR